MWMSRWSRLLVALVICVAALGCGSSAGRGGAGSPTQQSDTAAADAAAQQSNGTPGSPGGSPQGQAGGAPGAPGVAGNRKNPSQAIGAPVKIPPFTQIGSPGPGFIDKIHQEIKDAIRDGCKPRPGDCIRTVVKQRPGSELNPDCFAGTDPDTRTANTPDGMHALDPREVKVLVVYSGSTPDSYSCKEEESSSESNVDQQPTDSTAPTDTSQQPTDTSASTDTSQPEPPSS